MNFFCYAKQLLNFYFFALFMHLLVKILLFCIIESKLCITFASLSQSFASLSHFWVKTSLHWFSFILFRSILTSAVSFIIISRFYSLNSFQIIIKPPKRSLASTLNLAVCCKSLLCFIFPSSSNKILQITMMLIKVTNCFMSIKQNLKNFFTFQAISTNIIHLNYLNYTIDFERQSSSFLKFIFLFEKSWQWKNKAAQTTITIFLFPYEVQ